MGACGFILPQLLNVFTGYINYAGRHASASPAAGTMQAHQAQQAALIKQAFEV
jgi:2-oxoglutarate dehydrogenase complex dehydrogenase (E1) component-like enzyme